jgi:hypothetical protein
MDQYAQTTDLVELRDELAIQQTILASLLDNPNRDAIDQTEVRSAQQAISALCRQIKTLESKGACHAVIFQPRRASQAADRSSRSNQKDYEFDSIDEPSQSLFDACECIHVERIWRRL